MTGILSNAILAAAALAFVATANAQVVAVPESGTADAGIGSRPISNVAANDTVNGAPATLGASGNATISKVGTWATGIGLNTSTGAVTTTTSVAAAQYSIAYQLCDLSANCNSATDSVTVITSSIVPNSDSGSADQGIASRPIANVAANDMVNGAPATLGASGNATVSQVGAWPTGIALAPSTGAVSTTVTVPVGTYSIQYQLCDRNVPANCATTTDTVTVIAASIVANPDSGTADSGVASQPIANVAANDTINGAPATLGPGGNARVGKIGSWPNGIGLNATTGAVSTMISSADGSYTIQYELCDFNVPADCVTATDTITIITASILVNPDTGKGYAGIPATVIANVTVNDTVNGAVPILGTGGNAKVGQDGNWPTGIHLSSAGAVTISSAVAKGTYDFQYLLCDLNVPANCASATDEVTITSSVVANPDNGTSVAGILSRPINNVAVNDIVNGVQARLQTSPNATVASAGTWPTGISLDTTTGAVIVATTVRPGLYQFEYQLCNLKSPPVCSMATDSVTVETSLVALPMAGSAVVNVATTAIGNIAAFDNVNGRLPNFGTSGNATIAAVGSWPTGIALNTVTGAVTTTASVAVGNYPLSYQLCNRASPPVCATAPANVTVVAQPFAEVSVSPYMTGDIEFDWARDGLYCAQCNYGIGNSQFNWTDRNNNLWVSGVDPTTGAFTPISGRGTGNPVGSNNGNPVDTTAFFWQDWGNGPEWAFSTPPGAPGGNPVSQLVYTRFAPGQPATWEYAGSAIASVQLVNGAPTWVPSFLPGAYTSIANNTVLPEASQCPSDMTAYALFANLLSTQQMFTEPVTSAAGTAPTLTPFGSFANGIGEKFVACTADPTLTFQGNVTIGTSNLQQVFWYDLVTQTVQQLTFDPTTKQRAVMFRAPEFGGALTLMTLAADSEVQIYMANGTLSNGAPNMQLVNTIHSPDPAEANMFDPKVFIHCTAAYPLCKTYVIMGLSHQTGSQLTESQPNGLGVAGIDPANPMFELLATAQSLPATQRLDPKYFITSQNGPVVYYDSLLALTSTTPYQDLGIYMINLQLDAPSGPCVGSSAQEGLNPTWPNCTAGVPP